VRSVTKERSLLKKSTLGLGACAWACAALAGCGGKADKATEVNAVSPLSTASAANLSPRAQWRRVATDDDRNRLRLWRTTWVAAVAKARKSGNGPAIDAEGPLFDPDRALPNAKPPAGRYHCRVFKLGANGPAARDFLGSPVGDCRIHDEGEVASLYQITGAQRPVGQLYADGPERNVFLGTMALGDETKPLNYGLDTSRDMAGFVQRIGDRRWRLILPSPHFQSLLDVIELTPEQ
jgi:hypothetical protein